MSIPLFVDGGAIWVTLSSHGHKRYGGPYKILLPKQGIVPYGTSRDSLTVGDV